MNYMKKIIYLCLIFFITNAASSNDELTNISNTQKLFLDFLDSAEVNYDFIPSQNNQNVNLKNISFYENGSLITVENIEFINLNKIFDNPSSDSLNKYKGNLCDKIKLKNLKTPNASLEYFEISNVDIKDIDQLATISLDNITDFLYDIRIDKIYFKNILLYDDTFEGSFSFKIEDINKFKYGSWIISDLDYLNRLNQSSFFVETIMFKNYQIDKKVIENLISLFQGNPLDEDVSKYLFESKVDLFRINNFNYTSLENDIEIKFTNMDSVTDEYPEKGTFKFSDIYINKIRNKNLIYEEVLKKRNSNNLYDFVWNYNWNISKQKIRNELKLTSKNLFELIFDISISNYSINDYVNYYYQSEEFFKNLGKLKLNNLMFYYDDDGLIKTAYEILEREQSGSVEDSLILLKNQFLNDEYIKSIINENQLEQIDEVFDFLLKPRNIKINIKPNPELSFTQMQNDFINPQLLVEKLNIEIISNK